MSWQMDFRVESRCDELMKGVEQRMDEFESKLENRLTNLPQETTKKWSDMVKEGTPAVNKPADFRSIVRDTMVQQKKEETEKEAREKNAIIYNVDESESPAVEDRIQADASFFSDLCTEVLGVEDIELKKIVRIGAKTQKDGSARSKPRPLKVIFNQVEEKKDFMSLLPKLKDAEERFRKISVTSDYSIEERQKIQDKVKEAAEMTENEESKNWVYKVRGPPWNLQIRKFKRNDTEG